MLAVGIFVASIKEFTAAAFAGYHFAGIALGTDHARAFFNAFGGFAFWVFGASQKSAKAASFENHRCAAIWADLVSFFLFSYFAIAVYRFSILAFWIIRASQKFTIAS